MSDENEYLTKEKFEELGQELQELKTKKRKEVAENLEYAKSLGDLSENAEYHEAREVQANVEDRISKLEAILQSAVIMKDQHTDTISIGSTAVVVKENEKTNQIFTLVGSEEANVAEGKISIHSPLGEALIGKKKGQDFSFKTPSGAMKYTVVSIK